MKNKILIVFGTRPEAIKLTPIIKGLEKKKKLFNVKICITGQHDTLLYPILDFFKINPHYNLKVMKNNQNLFYLTSKILDKISKVLDIEKPDFVMVHGDTTTTFVASLSSFYKQIKLLHIEAGLRTNNIYSPYPEEFNRFFASKLSFKHFSPTLENKKNLLKENIASKNIFVTGNTSIDTLKLTINSIKKSKIKNIKINSFLKKILKFNYNNDKFILFTVHRRENFGKGIINIFNAIKKISISNKNIHIIFPVHPNPNIRKISKKYLNNISNVHLIKPLNYEYFVYLLNKSYFVISDSGGLQEEAPFLSKPLIVLRDITERPAISKKQKSIIVGSNEKKIIYYAQKLINNKQYYKKMSYKNRDYGDGNATKKIIRAIENL